MTTKRLKEWAREHITAIRWSIVAVMLLIGFWGLVLGARHAPPQYAIADTWWGRDLGYFLVNLGPELAGIVIGVVAIDALNGWRQDEQLKEQLILQMNSRHNDVADTAISTLKAKGWLEDGSLEGANLLGANLQETNLVEANLQGANLIVANLRRANPFGANLQGASLDAAKLQEANLGEANLQGASLVGAKLQGAGLYGANLQGANLHGADLQGADLQGADLQGADLQGADLQGAYLPGAIMPDGTQLKATDYPEGPSYEEWLAMQDSQEEEQ